MPLAASPPTTWLSTLTIAQLRRAACAIGAPSSGTKPVLIQQIRRALAASDPTADRHQTQAATPRRAKDLSIVSIDMGIRNLAYAHLLAAPVWARKATAVSAPSTPQQPSLVAWEQVVISGARNSPGASTTRSQGHQRSTDAGTPPLHAANGAPDEGLQPDPAKEAFDPSTFASYAYQFITGVLCAHQPTHVLIERQRFRSGGASAVQEWTIRVGVFEGMLHAVLKTLSEERGLHVVVQSVDPGRVTRYWLADRTTPARQRMGSARESKKAKIDLVGDFLGRADGSLVSIHPENHPRGSRDVGQVVDAFLARWKKKKDGSRTDSDAKDMVKLDDLSDCLLQGLAWLNWQKTRQDVSQRGLEAFAGDPVFAAVRLPHVKPGRDSPHHATRARSASKPLGSET